MKNLLLLLFVVGIVSCTQNATTTETNQVDSTSKNTNSKSASTGRIEYVDEDYSLVIEIDKYERSFLFGKGILKNKRDTDNTFAPSSLICVNNGTEGALYLNQADGLKLEDRENMTKEEIRDFHMKNYSKLMPIQKIELKPNEERSLNVKINFSKPIGDPKQTILKKNSPSEK